MAHGVRRRRWQLAAVARVAVVVEDDLAVEVFEAGHGRLLSEAEDVGCAVERIGQRVDVVLVVVQVEAGARGGVHAEQAHQRLGAVVAGADAHVALVEHLAEVVRVDVAEGEAERRAADLDVRRAVELDVVAEALGERA